MLVLVVRRGSPIIALAMLALVVMALAAPGAQPQSMTPAPRTCDIPRFEDAKRVKGTTKDDNIRGGGRSEVITARAGNDRVHGGGGSDCIDGGRGRDRLTGGSGNDRIIGGAGNDVIVGGAGRDTIYCGAGRDVAYFSQHDRAFDCERGVQASP